MHANRRGPGRAQANQRAASHCQPLSCYHYAAMRARAATNLALARFLRSHAVCRRSGWVMMESASQILTRHVFDRDSCLAKVQEGARLHARLQRARTSLVSLSRRQFQSGAPHSITVTNPRAAATMLRSSAATRAAHHEAEQDGAERVFPAVAKGKVCG